MGRRPNLGLECGARSDHEHGDEVGRDLAVTIDGVSAVAFGDGMDELRSGGSREYEILISDVRLRSLTSFKF